jgi:hypothetical protein
VSADLEVSQVVTAELLLSKEEAQGLTDSAKAELTESAQHFENAWDLIDKAITGEAHTVLGYKSAGDYLMAEFGNLLKGLDVADRRTAVRELTKAGIATRAAAATLGVDRSTVVRDRAPGDASASPGVVRPDATQVATVTGVDGKHYPARVTRSRQQDARDNAARRVGQLQRSLPAVDRTSMKNLHGALGAKALRDLAATLRTLAEKFDKAAALDGPKPEKSRTLDAA